MSGGWGGSNRRDTLPADWAATRERILRRDLYRCRWRMPDGSLCREVANQVDHKVRGAGDQDSNLQALCEPHHAIKSSREGNEARREKKRRALLPADRSTLRG